MRTRIGGLVTFDPIPERLGKGIMHWMLSCNGWYVGVVSVMDQPLVNAYMGSEHAVRRFLEMTACEDQH